MEIICFVLINLVAVAYSSHGNQYWANYISCPENEYIPKCLPCPSRSCGEKNFTGCSSQCVPNDECQCYPGYLRNKKGICVKIQECDCAQNEFIPKCLPCPSSNCKGEKDYTGCLSDCVPNYECQCYPGFLRNDEGVCVLRAECGCKKNEYIPRCIPCAPLSCADRNDTTCSELCDHNYYYNCYCMPGFLRNKEGDCVKQTECACGENEHIPKCVPCPPLNCDVSKDIICTKECEPNTECQCKPGFLRNKEGVCVEETKCGSCGENEYIPECVPCPPSNSGDKNNTVCSQECIPNKECYCNPGFSRNAEGVCVEETQWACGENEHIPKCVPCPPLNCGDSKDTVCSQECTPNNECQCKPGFLRNEEGACVEETECACGDNEYIPECVPCPPINCDDPSDTVCTEECQLNKECYCKPGFLRNNEGVCVEEAECVCGENEYIPKCVPCATPINCGDTANSDAFFSYQNDPTCTENCKPNNECYCKSGFLRNEEGICIKEAECACGENEHIPDCVPDAINCGDTNNTVYEQGCNPNNQCYCKPGFLRNREGVCVTEAACACRDDEYFSVCEPCGPKNCGDREGVKCKSDCKIVNKCYCKGNLLRNRYGKCVKKEYCPRRNSY